MQRPAGWHCDTAPTVLYSLLYDLLRLLIEIMIVRGRGDAQLRAEVLALRHELGVLERQVGRPRCQPTDRLLLSAISRALPKSAWRSLPPSPETLLRWHRELVRRKWAAYRRRPRRQRPVLRSELHDLIVKLAEQNPRWGYRRIEGELVKLGHRCSHWTVRKVLGRHGLPPAPRRGQRSWGEFVRQHADQILACDFFFAVIHLPYRRPVANSFAERFVGTCRREVLDHLLIFGRGHLERVLGVFIEHYNHARPHQGLEQRRPCEPAHVIPLSAGRVERRDRLGGVLHEYFRAA